MHGEVIYRIMFKPLQTCRYDFLQTKEYLLKIFQQIGCFLCIHTISITIASNTGGLMFYLSYRMTLNETISFITCNIFHGPHYSLQSSDAPEQ